MLLECHYFVDPNPPANPAFDIPPDAISDPVSICVYGKREGNGWLLLQSLTDHPTSALTPKSRGKLVSINHNLPTSVSSPRPFPQPSLHTRSQSVDAHPRHPQLTHCTSWSSLSCARGTRHTHVELKLVSLVWMQRRQHSFSYPCFFHLAMSMASA